MFVWTLIRRSSNHNYSLLNYFWFPVACSVLPLISQSKQSDECTWRRMSLPLRNLYKCKQVVHCYLCILFTLSFALLLPVYLFIPFLYCTVVVACLLLYPFFFLTDVVAIHTYIHNWSLQPFCQDYWPSFSHRLCCVC